MSVFVVLGAGGPTGLECVRVLQQKGEKVRCVVRDPAKYAGKFGDAEVVKGSVTDEESMVAALQGATGVIFAVSASTYKGEGGPYEVDYLGVEKTLRAAQANNVERYILISSRLVNPATNKWHPIRMMLNNIKYSLMDYKFEGEQVLRKSDMKYTVVRPGGLVGGEGSGPHVRPADVQPGTQFIVAGAAEADMGGGSSIHRADVAQVVVQALLDESAAFKTIEVVARPAESSDPAFADRVQTIFKDIPVEKEQPAAGSAPAEKD